MSTINLLLAGLGGGITLTVAIGMVFLTPRGVETLVEPPYEQPLPRAEPEVILDAEVASHA